MHRKIAIVPEDMRVLIVDSKKANFNMLRRCCNSTGIEDKKIIWAESGALAIQEFKRRRPHLVFIDKDMLASDLVVSSNKTVIIRNGIDAMLTMRKYQDGYRRRPVIIGITDDKSQKSIEEFEDAGTDGFFHKPFTMGVLATFPALMYEFFEFNYFDFL